MVQATHCGEGHVELLCKCNIRVTIRLKVVSCSKKVTHISLLVQQIRNETLQAPQEGYAQQQAQVIKAQSRLPWKEIRHLTLCQHLQLACKKGCSTCVTGELYL